ncbi:hypothetical protein P280DRAFT_473823 [Massarina eburnea CBS 473.64]|uniref:Uncharacterized protein n=1 Tax=Massarina eburnea CBS 473.64 TaxID=1395130 RepID=A0A6A6RMN2_9PLEO|nr:hypothetical protein P280DRAFT_473823 [Massarina eburnea CBS 473.64]
MVLRGLGYRGRARNLLHRVAGEGRGWEDGERILYLDGRGGGGVETEKRCEDQSETG